ncbi:MAG: hypothetical protein KKA73_19510 [Chloroflexi bacterium]|nr:hypothetical protein [Chloroflexota bacterium]MBU1749875.1 hypothetical protein [Chloroflexota bacterium]
MNLSKTIYNRRLILLAAALVTLATLLLVSTTLAQSGGHDPLAWYTVEQGTAAGGSYRLSSLTWHASGTARGEGYHLIDIGQSGPFGNCCCTFLPLVIRLHP